MVNSFPDLVAELLEIRREFGQEIVLDFVRDARDQSATQIGSGLWMRQPLVCHQCSGSNRDAAGISRPGIAATGLCSEGVSRRVPDPPRQTLLARRPVSCIVADDLAHE